jgi:predicted DCC family thiol-disulfide oxidoreductase YuxK
MAMEPPARCDRDANAAALTVLYDGSCPLCRREIAVYRDLEPLARVCFADVSDPTLATPLQDLGRTREELLARFHVQRSDGVVLSGASAFLALWAVLPGWRWLARLGRLPGATWAMEFVYRAFLRARPALQRWARRLERRRLGRTTPAMTEPPKESS